MGYHNHEWIIHGIRHKAGCTRTLLRLSAYILNFMLLSPMGGNHTGKCSEVFKALKKDFHLLWASIRTQNQTDNSVSGAEAVYVYARSREMRFSRFHEVAEW